MNGVPINDVLLMGKYALWNRFQQFLFSSDILRYHSLGGFDAYKEEEGGHNRKLSFKGFIVGMFGVGVSFYALVHAALARPRVILFGIDRVSGPYQSDFRTAELHQYLREHHVPYAECLHTVFNQKFIKNFGVRGRSALYLESLDTLYSILRFLHLTRRPPELAIEGFNDMTDDESRFARYVINKYLGQQGAIEFRIRALRFFIRVSGARALWAIDDARHYHDIMAAAHDVGVPSYAFQHGHFTKYHVGWLVGERSQGEYMRPDYLVVWSAYWKKELARLHAVFPTEAIIVGAPERKMLTLPKKLFDRTTILIPHETDSSKKEVSRIIQALVGAGINVIIKLRQDHPVKSQVEEYSAVPVTDEAVTFVTNLSELTARPHAVIGVYSTFLYEMVELRIPVGVCVDLSDYGSGMVENGLANPVRLVTLIADIDSLVATPQMERDRRFASLADGVTPLRDTLGEICSTLPI